MCLEAEGLKVIAKPTKDEVWAWKVILLDDKKPGHFVDGVFADSLPLGRWLKARDKVWEPRYGYPAGFHAFETREAARGWTDEGECVLRVRLRRIVARGVQTTFYALAPALVAREMFIPLPKSKRRK